MAVKAKYKIGDWVEVTAVAEVDYVDRKSLKSRLMGSQTRIIVSSPLPKPFLAQIIGAKRRQVGVYHSGSYIPLEDSPPYLVCKGTVLVWLVRRGMTNKAIEVLPDDLVLYSDVSKLSLPWRQADTSQWSDEAKEIMREDAKNAPRNSRGQFTV